MLAELPVQPRPALDKGGSVPGGVHTLTSVSGAGMLAKERVLHPCSNTQAASVRTPRLAGSVTGLFKRHLPDLLWELPEHHLQ